MTKKFISFDSLRPQGSYLDLMVLLFVSLVSNTEARRKTSKYHTYIFCIGKMETVRLYNEMKQRKLKLGEAFLSSS